MIRFRRFDADGFCGWVLVLKNQVQINVLVNIHKWNFLLFAVLLYFSVDLFDTFFVLLEQKSLHVSVSVVFSDTNFEMTSHQFLIVPRAKVQLCLRHKVHVGAWWFVWHICTEESKHRRCEVCVFLCACLWLGAPCITCLHFGVRVFHSLLRRCWGFAH